MTLEEFLSTGGYPVFSTPKRRLTGSHDKVSEIIGVCAAIGRVSVQELKGPRRASKYLLPRQVAMCLAAELMPAASLPWIGRAFDRDHTTILHTISVKAAKMKDPAFRDLYDEAMERLDG